MTTSAPRMTSRGVSTGMNSASTSPAMWLQSRAWDEAGNVQPTRSEMFAERGEPKVNVPVTAFPMGHMNVITSWAIDNKGEAKYVYG
jgi:hypothetical protein